MRKGLGAAQTEFAHKCRTGSTCAPVPTGRLLLAAHVLPLGTSEQRGNTEGNQIQQEMHCTNIASKMQETNGSIRTRRRSTQGNNRRL